MRLLAALQYYLPQRTGYTLHVQRVAEALVARGHAVTVLTARHLPELPARETLAGVDVVRLHAPLRVSRGMVMPGYPWHAARLAATADTVWINTPLAETALWSLVAGVRRRRLVVTHHGDLCLPAGFANRLIERFTYANYRVAAQAADAIVGYSDDYAEHSDWLRRWRAKVTIISPPIAIPAPDRAAAAALRRRLAPRGGPLVGYAGRFVEEKRPDLLLQAALALRDRYPGFQVGFAGQHRIPYEDTWARCAGLVAAVGDGVTFLGTLTEPQALADFYAACDVLVLPSDSECFALVQAEAMLCGTPVVASDIPGARVPVRVTGMGRLFRAGDAADLAAALDDVLGDRSRFVVAPEKIAATFALGRTVDAYEAVLFPPRS